MIEFIIERLPKTPNSIGKTSFWYSQRERLYWRTILKMKINEQPQISKLSLPYKKARLTLTRCSSRECDVDNLYASWKFTIDGIKFNGLIVDDKPSCIDLVCKWEKTSPKNGHVKIKIEPI